PCTDHVPILLTLDLNLQHTDSTPRCNWREVDWEAFNNHMSKMLEPHPPTPIATEDKFQQAACQLTEAIMETMVTIVPLSKPCPHSKCWWTKDLTNLCKQVSKANCLAYQMQGLPDHKCHTNLKALKNCYAELIELIKKQHWIEWLENIEGNDLWTANKYISTEPMD
ncbi:hypothetical protein BDR04DRAFT_944448, partial [Suillus decipiens]